MSVGIGQDKKNDCSKFKFNEYHKVVPILALTTQARTLVTHVGNGCGQNPDCSFFDVGRVGQSAHGG